MLKLNVINILFQKNPNQLFKFLTGYSISLKRRIISGQEPIISGQESSISGQEYWISGQEFSISGQEYWVSGQDILALYLDCSIIINAI